MGIRNKNSTNYVHPDEPNLLNLHKAMEYNLTGQPVLRAHVDGITLQGDVLVDAVKLWDGTRTLDFEQVTDDGEAGQPSIPAESYNMVFNGSTWDRMRGNINDGVLVNLSNDSIAVTQSTNPWIVKQGSDPWTVSLSQASLDALETVTVNQGTAGSESWKVNIGTNGEVKLVAGSAVIGKVSLVDSGGNNNDANHPVYVAGTVTVNQVAGEPTLVKYINTPNNLQMDMTQRLRVSNNTQSWWYAPTVDKDGDLRYIESYTGTNAGSIFVQNLASINMSPGTDSNGSFIRISRRRHKMRPGASMTAAFSVNWNGYVPDGNVTKRVGVFTGFNGVFFEMTGDLQAVIRRRLTDGTLVEKRIARADFNIDKLDGTGETGYDLRPVVLNTSTITAYVSKTAVPISGDGTVYQVVFTVGTPSQFTVGMKGRITGVSPALYSGTVMVTAINGSNVTFVYNIDPGVFSSLSSAKFEHSALHNQYVFGFDFNGNRATSVRFFIDGPLGRVAVHQENFGGALSTPFSNAPAISTRYEIFNTGSPSRLPNLTCSSELINVEADVELNPSFGVAQRSTTLAISKGTRTEYALLGIALRTGEPYQRGDLQVQGIQVIDAGNVNTQNAGVYQWRLVLNPTFGGTAVPTADNIGKASRMWNYNNGTTITGGITVTGGYVTSTQQIDVKNALNFLNLGSNIAYDDSDKLVLAIKLLVDGTSDASLLASMNFIEAL